MNIEQKKGDQHHIDGRITVYAIIETDSEDILTMKHPIASMVHNGLLVAQGNFKEQSSLKDFLKSEMGISLDNEMDEGLAQLLDKMNGLEAALDPQKLKDHLENMGEEFIPTPAKIVPFHSEMEILSQDGDIFFIGTFKNIGNAVLGVNALPILYQARFREQEASKIRNEIELLISQIERTDSSPMNETVSSEIDVEQKILKDFIPKMLYYRKEPHTYKEAEEQFRKFMIGYPFKDDVEAITGLLGSDQELSTQDYKLLELYAKKIAAVKKEDFAAAELYTKEIQSMHK